MSIIRENLMREKEYRPYCGNGYCGGNMPRTVWTGKQFKCFSCHWISKFPDDFIAEYKAKWYPTEPLHPHNDGLDEYRQPVHVGELDPAQRLALAMGGK